MTEAIRRHKIRILALVAVAAVATGGVVSYFSCASVDPAETVAQKSKKPKKEMTKPRWSELSATQRDALAPLAAEWDHINPARKMKWIEIGNRIALMPQEEKLRAQERIRDWIKLTPEQRKTARVNYAQAKKLSSQEKFAEWQRYQQLTEEQRKELAAAGVPTKALVVNPPARTEKIAKSLKSTPRSQLEKSVQPPATPAPAQPVPAAPSEASPV